MLYFEVTCQGQAAVIACENAKPALVKAKALEEIRGYIGETLDAGTVRIAPAKGMSAGELGERWFGYLEHFESWAKSLVEEAHFDFEVDDPSLSRISPPRFRHSLGQEPEYRFKEPFGYIYKGVLNLLDWVPEDRLAFNRAFDKLTAPALNKHAIDCAFSRARKLLEAGNSRDDVEGFLVDGYYVSKSQAGQIVEHVLNPPPEPEPVPTPAPPPPPEQADLFA